MPAQRYGNAAASPPPRLSLLSTKTKPPFITFSFSDFERKLHLKIGRAGSMRCDGADIFTITIETVLYKRNRVLFVPLLALPAQLPCVTQQQPARERHPHHGRLLLHTQVPLTRSHPSLQCHVTPPRRQGCRRLQLRPRRVPRCRPSPAPLLQLLPHHPSCRRERGVVSSQR